MLARTYAPALFGISSRLVEIECDVTNGLPGIVIVGLADKAVGEAKERIRSAIHNSGLMLPPKRLTLNLAPANLPKDGSGYDLGIALAVLAASDQIDPNTLKGSLFLGELALDGTVRPAKGAVMAAQLVRKSGFKRLFVPAANAAEASLVADTEVFAINSLIEVYEHLTKKVLLSPIPSSSLPSTSTPSQSKVDLEVIYGQTQAKRALEIAAAGGHNILLSGPPGTGKTLLAKALIGILPNPTLEEAIEITKLHTFTGANDGKVMRTRPFRAPHHTISNIALVGGGAKPHPGEISLAHHGVLFLDELPEFPRSVLEALRQPMEEGSITVARGTGTITFPADFMLIATRNPCPCGYAGDPIHTCSCRPSMLTQYKKKLSGPLLDRIDIEVEVNRIDQQSIISALPEEPSNKVAERVAKARLLQLQRNNLNGPRYNSRIEGEQVREYCRIDNDTEKIALQALQNLGISNRAYTRILKVARTIADLDGREAITTAAFTEALQYRPRNSDKLLEETGTEQEIRELNLHQTINRIAQAGVA